METHSLQIRRRLYPGQVEAIPVQLPESYLSDQHYTSIQDQNCNNCFFNQNGKCDYWKAKVRDEYRCDLWRSLTSTAPIPDPPPCLTGITIPILLTQDFNDIGVYTPFDGLAIQRDVLVNFIYTGNGNTITIFNTADVEFRKFLRVAPYDINWGDGTTSQLSPPLQITATHTYTTPSTGYTITLSQINPWGTTFISKTLPIPYFNSPTIPNPFGNFSMLAPNIGDPIGCDSVTQDWIFWGDSNPDVFDSLSSNWVNTPFAVTGFSYASQLKVLTQYGPTVYPTVGTVVDVGLSGTGVITTISSWYTAYTLNDINYIDYSGGTTAYSAMSMGLDHNNIDYYCCKEEVSGGTSLKMAMPTKGIGSVGSAIVYGGPQSNMTPLPNLPPPPVSNITPIARLFECVNTVCSEIPEGSWIDDSTAQSNYSTLLSQNNIFDSLEGCNANCGCTEIQNLNLLINNVKKCSTITITNANGIMTNSFDCDGVIEIGGFTMVSSEFTITNNNVGESITIYPSYGQYNNVFFDNLCPSNYTNINGPAEGIYKFTILDDKGCTKQLSILVETND